MRVEHLDISGVAARFKPGLFEIWIFMGKSYLLVTVQSQVYG